METCRTSPTAASQGAGCGINVGEAERLVSCVAGGLLLLHGFAKLPFSTIVVALAGGSLLYRGMTGHCSAYQALNMSTAGEDDTPCNSSDDEGQRANKATTSPAVNGNS